MGSHSASLLPPVTHRSSKRHLEFMQDGAPVHKVKAVGRWFRLKGVKPFNNDTWPAHSPDLNPIENMWAEAVRAMAGQIYTSKQDLWTAAETAFHNIPNGYVQHLYSGMPRRLNAVIEAQGGHTKY